MTDRTDRPLVPRRILFGNPERTAGAISPNGRWLGYLAPVDGVLNVWVAPADAPDQARAVTADRVRGIGTFRFAHTDHLLHLQDQGGDENFQVFATDLATGETRALTPLGARADITALSPRHPTEILVSTNARDPQYFDLVAIDLVSGASRTVFENDRYVGLLVDQDYVVVAGSAPRPDGGLEISLRGPDGALHVWREVAPIDALTTVPIEVTDDGKTMWMIDSRDRDTAALIAVDLASGAERVVHADPRADVMGILLHPATQVAEAVVVEVERMTWTVLDPAVAGDLARLRAHVGPACEFDVVSRTLDDRRWVVTRSRPDASSTYLLYDRPSGTVTEWFRARPALNDLPLAGMTPVSIPTRDGLHLVGYLTLPVAVAQPVPLVLLVHGGPWARDHYRADPFHLWLADRGFAVLSVNFRGSTGFGKAFLAAGDLEWGRKMHDDLLDAVAFAVGRGVTRPDTVAIMGGSYGGYATLVGLTFTPEVFACGVSIVGPSSLLTLLGSIPPYWGPMKVQFTTRVGDDGTEEGRKLLADRSPLGKVDAIVRPLLIVQGKNDPRVKVTESDQIVAAMERHGIPVTYLLYPDEGHGLARPENRMSMCAAIEVFFARIFGTRFEPVGSDLEGASIEVPAGAALLPALAEALKARGT